LATIRLLFRLIAGYTSLIVIGLGSVLFHATLKYEMQLMDEVPMIYGTAVIGYCIFQVGIEDA
jgi:dihydroceramidase